MLKKFKSAARDWALGHKERSSEDKTFKMLTMCKQCYTFYYRNSWHFERPEYLEQTSEQELPVKFVQCPACLEQELAMYEKEGELVSG